MCTIKSNYFYLTNHDDEKRLGAWINTVGFQEIPAGSNYPVSEHPASYLFSVKKGRVLNEYQLVYITDGEGIFIPNLDDPDCEEIHIKKGTIILLYPGQRHTYYPLQKTGWKEYFIGFEGDFFFNLIKRTYPEQKNCSFNIGLNSEIIQLFLNALSMAENKFSHFQDCLVGITFHIFGLLFIAADNTDDVSFSTKQKIEQSKIYMNEHISEMIDWDVLSRELGVSYSWFRKEFKLITGESPAKYFAALKIKKAQKLLAEERLTAKEVAYELGFPSPELFLSNFKRFTGQTPTDFKNSKH